MCVPCCVPKHPAWPREPSPPSLHPSPSPSHWNLLCLLFPGTSQCTPRKTRTSSSIPGQTFQICGSAHALSKSLVIFSLLGQARTLHSESSHPFRVPLWLPDQRGPCSIFPTSSRNTFAHPAGLPFPAEPLHPPGWSSGHVQSDTLQQRWGSHPRTFCSPPQLLGACPTGVLPCPGWPRAPGGL